MNVAALVVALVVVLFAVPDISANQCRGTPDLFGLPLTDKNQNIYCDHSPEYRRKQTWGYGCSPRNGFRTTLVRDPNDSGFSLCGSWWSVFLPAPMNAVCSLLAVIEDPSDGAAWGSFVLDLSGNIAKGLTKFHNSKMMKALDASDKNSKAFKFHKKAKMVAQAQGFATKGAEKVLGKDGFNLLDSAEQKKEVLREEVSRTRSRLINNPLASNMMNIAQHGVSDKVWIDYGTTDPILRWKAGAREYSTRTTRNTRLSSSWWAMSTNERICTGEAFASRDLRSYLFIDDVGVVQIRFLFNFIVWRMNEPLTWGTDTFCFEIRNTEAVVYAARECEKILYTLPFPTGLSPPALYLGDNGLLYIADLDIWDNNSTHVALSTNLISEALMLFQTRDLRGNGIMILGTTPDLGEYSDFFQSIQVPPGKGIEVWMYSNVSYGGFSKRFDATTSFTSGTDEMIFKSLRLFREGIEISLLGSEVISPWVFNTNDFIVSPNGEYYAYMQNKTYLFNFVVSHKSGMVLSTLAVSGPELKASLDDYGNFLIYQKDFSNVIMFNASQSTEFRCNNRQGPFSLTITDSGALLVADAYDAICNILYAPFMTTMEILGRGAKTSVGEYTLEMQLDCNLVIRFSNGFPVWTSETGISDERFHDCRLTLSPVNGGLQVMDGFSTIWSSITDDRTIWGCTTETKFFFDGHAIRLHDFRTNSTCWVSAGPAMFSGTLSQSSRLVSPFSLSTPRYALHLTPEGALALTNNATGLRVWSAMPQSATRPKLHEAQFDSTIGRLRLVDTVVLKTVWSVDSSSNCNLTEAPFRLVVAMEGLVQIVGSTNRICWQSTFTDSYIGNLSKNEITYPLTITLYSANRMFRFQYTTNGIMTLALVPTNHVFWMGNNATIMLDGTSMRLSDTGDVELIPFASTTPSWRLSTAFPGTWQCGSRTGPFKFGVQDDGNMVIIDGSRNVCWQSNTENYLWNSGVLVLSAGKSISTGSNSLVLDWDGVLRYWVNGIEVWRSPNAPANTRFTELRLVLEGDLVIWDREARVELWKASDTRQFKCPSGKLLTLQVSPILNLIDLTQNLPFPCWMPRLWVLPKGGYPLEAGTQIGYPSRSAVLSYDSDGFIRIYKNITQSTSMVTFITRNSTFDFNNFTEPLVYQSDLTGPFSSFFQTSLYGTWNCNSPIYADMKYLEVTQDCNLQVVDASGLVCWKTYLGTCRNIYEGRILFTKDVWTNGTMEFFLTNHGGLIVRNSTDTNGYLLYKSTNALVNPTSSEVALHLLSNGDLVVALTSEGLLRTLWRLSLNDTAAWRCNNTGLFKGPFSLRLLADGNLIIQDSLKEKCWGHDFRKTGFFPITASPDFDALVEAPSSLQGPSYFMIGQSLLSSNGLYRFDLLKDRRFTIFSRPSKTSIQWVQKWEAKTQITGMSPTCSAPAISGTSTSFRGLLSDDGNLVIQDWDGIKWSWTTDCSGNAILGSTDLLGVSRGPYSLVMGDDGRLVLQDKDNVAVWAVLSEGPNTNTLDTSSMITSNFGANLGLISPNKLWLFGLTNGVVTLRRRSSIGSAWSTASSGTKRRYNYFFPNCDALPSLTTLSTHTILLKSDGDLVAQLDPKSNSYWSWTTDCNNNFVWDTTLPGTARGPFKLVLNDMGQLILTDKDGRYVWVHAPVNRFGAAMEGAFASIPTCRLMTRSNGNPVPSGTDFSALDTLSQLSVQPDGNIVMYKRTSTTSTSWSPIWVSRNLTFGTCSDVWQGFSSTYQWVVLSNGDTQARRSSGQIYWTWTADCHPNTFKKVTSRPGTVNSPYYFYVCNRGRMFLLDKTGATVWGAQDPSPSITTPISTSTSAVTVLTTTSSSDARLYSPTRNFYLALQPDGNLVYYQISGSTVTPLWVARMTSGTNCQDIQSTLGTYSLTISSLGGLSVIRGTTTTWSWNQDCNGNTMILHKVPTANDDPFTLEVLEGRLEWKNRWGQIFWYFQR